MTRRTMYTVFLGAAAFAGGVIAAAQSAPNTISAKERADGWRLLFDGKTTAGWRGFRQQTMPGGWQAVDGTLTRVGTAGDIVTIDEFGDFEMTLEWKLSPNGNSGLFYRVTEDDDVMWHLAPEYQIIDKTRLLVRGAHVEHWLNGMKVVEYELWTPDWERRVRDSKFKEYPKYARARRGHIGLQDHGDRAAYRNIKIRAITN